MLDHPEKTTRLLADLKAAVPFAVELAPRFDSCRPKMSARSVKSTLSATYPTPVTRVALCAICPARKRKKEHSLYL